MILKQLQPVDKVNMALAFKNIQPLVRENPAVIQLVGYCISVYYELGQNYLFHYFDLLKHWVDIGIQLELPFIMEHAKKSLNHDNLPK